MGLLFKRKPHEASENEQTAQQLTLSDTIEIPSFLILQINRIWQVFQTADRYVFIEVSGKRAWTGQIDYEKLQASAPSDLHLEELPGKNYYVRKVDIQRVILSPRSVEVADGERAIIYDITLFSPQKRKYVQIMDLKPEQIEAFFADVADRVEIGRLKVEKW